MTTVALVLGLIQPASANPHHSAGDYVLFAKALATGITSDPKAFEPACNGSNDGQGETSGQGNTYFGRIHSNADLKLTGANTFAQTVSPDTEITYGVNEPATCQLQSDGSNVFQDGSPVNITGSGDGTSVQGPYQIGPGGWPGNLGTLLTQTGADAFETFPNDSSTSAIGLTCDIGLLTDTTDRVVTLADNGRVVCNGTGKIIISLNDLGTPGGPGVPATPPPVPFRITMLSHGVIETPGQNNVLAPALDGHGILAWTDVPFSTEASGIKFNGSNVDVPERSILFAPRTGIDVSGSNDNDVCIQAIGQGIVKVAGSNSRFGPFGPNCGSPATVVTDIHANLNGNLHFSLGQSGTVEVGTQVHDKVTVTSNANANLTGTITANRYNNGTCTGNPAATASFGPPPTDFAAAQSVTLEDVLPFTPAVGVYSYQASYGGDPSNLAATGACEGPLRVVDAQIDLSPLVDINRVNDPHTVNATVQQDDGLPAGAPGGDAVTGFGPAPNGTLVTFSLLNNNANANFVGAINTCTTTGGTCSVQINTTTPGTVEIRATTTFSVATVSLTRTTGSGGLNSADAIKRFVDARISIDPDDVNRVGQSHTFTVTVEANDGSGAGFQAIDVAAVTVNLTAGAANVVDNCADGTGDAGEAVGQCTVTFTSNAPGVITGSASAAVVLTTAQGNINLPVSTTDGNSPTGNALKRFVDARISIDPDDTNGIGESHTFTVLVEADNGSGAGFQPIDVAAVTVSLVGDADSVVDNCADGTGDAGENTGECTVTFTSDTAGTVTGSASATVAITTAQGTINVAVSTADANSPTGSAVKTFVVGSLRWLKHDGQGQLLAGATFQVCRTHDRFGTDIADECVTVLDNTAPDTDPTGGEFQLQGLKLGRWTIDETVPPPGFVGDPFIETIELTVANPDGTATHIWVNTLPGGATLLIIDEDSIDNGIHVNKSGGLITPAGPQFFSDTEVNDQIAAYGQRTPLAFFANPANFGRTITVKTGQTGDEGWFAPTCIPPKWINGSTPPTCLTPETRQPGINAFFGANNVSTLAQSRLDKIPAVMPLRALGLNALVGKDICAVVYDSDISINYDKSSFPFTSGNLQGATLGIVAFTVNTTTTLDGFSSSTLPQVTITIKNPTTCNPTELFNAPVPKSSSVPNDRIAPGSATGYRQVKTFPLLPLFF